MNKKNYGLIFLVIAIAFVFFDMIFREKTLKELNVRGKVTSALIISCTGAGWSSGPYMTFKYNVNGGVFFGRVRGLGINDYCLYKGRRFELKYLEEDPSKKEINMEKEIINYPNALDM